MMITPIEGRHYITQGYGLTAFANTPQGQKLYKNFGGIHPGIDIGTGGINLPVISTVAGKVVAAGANGGWGNMVEVEGADGWRRQFAHLQSVEVKKGDKVLPGKVLGRVGTTGASTGVHLHFGLRKWSWNKWVYRDPAMEVDKELDALKLPTAKIIKEKGGLRLWAWTGKKKFYIPDVGTLQFFFGGVEPEEVEADILTKLPDGGTLTTIL